MAPKVTSSNWVELTTNMFGGGGVATPFPTTSMLQLGSYSCEREKNMDPNFESCGGGNLFIFVLCGLLCR